MSHLQQLDSAPLAYDMSPAERTLRIELAAAFRVGHHYRWNLQINNHITARIPDRPDRFLMNPYGLGWDEITASRLVTIDFSGKILSHDGIRLAPAGYNFHSGILKALPQIGNREHPRMQFEVAQDGDKVIVMPTLVYGDPARARVDGKTLVHFGGTLPIRDEDAERRLVHRLRDELNLVPGRRVELTGRRRVQEQVRCVERDRAFDALGRIAGIAEGVSV